MIEILVAFAFGGAAGLVGFALGATRKRRPIIIEKTNPFDERYQLPPNVAYAGAIQVIAFATTGEYGDTNVPYLRAVTALKRFGDEYPEVVGSYGPPPFLEV